MNEFKMCDGRTGKNQECKYFDNCYEKIDCTTFGEQYSDVKRHYIAGRGFCKRDDKNKKCCETCAYHDDFSWVCFNPEAENRADFTDNEYKCNCWSSREDKPCREKT